MSTSGPGREQPRSGGRGYDSTNCSRSHVRHPGRDEPDEDLADLFASLVREVERDRSDSTRRLEAQVAKREKVYLLAFEEIQAAAKQVADVVRPLFDIPGLGVEDVKALLNGVAQGVYLDFVNDRRGRR